MDQTARRSLVRSLLAEADAMDVAAQLSPEQLDDLYDQVVAALRRAAMADRAATGTPSAKQGGG